MVTSAAQDSSQQRQMGRGVRRLARAIPRIGALLSVLGTTSGCILQADLPDPALDIPATYREAGPAARQAADAPPALDWWQGFRSRELTALMEEAQRVNLDIAAATSRLVQADALALELVVAEIRTGEGRLDLRELEPD